MQSVGIILYILFFAGAAGGIWTRLNRNNTKNSKSYVLKSILFFFAELYFLVSAIKFYLGEPENTLLESFWDAESRTYLHYGIVFILISIVTPFLMKRLFSSFGYHLVHTFDSIYAVIIVIGLTVFGQIDNRSYCILYVVCMLAGGVISLYDQNHPRKESMFWVAGLSPQNEFRLMFAEALPFVSAWAVMTGIYFPNELYLHNLDEFAGNYAAFFLIMLAGSAAEIVLLILIFWLFLPKKIFKVMYLFFAGISCAGYLQSMFLNGTLNALNGEEQTWSGQTILVNACIWIVIILLCVIGGYHRSIVRKVCQLLCVYISLIQIVTLGWLLITSDVNNRNENEAITNKGALELAQEDNVLVFVLDGFDSSWFEEIYQEDSSILEPLADFTYYRNGTSQFAHTNNGIPYMLTGTEWNPDDINYAAYAYENSDVLEQIAEHGTDVRIFTDLVLMPESLYQRMDNYSDTVVRRYKIGETYQTMVRTSMYKTVPFLLKPFYEYYTSDIEDITYNNEIWSIDNDLLFYYNIVENGFSISEDEKSAFRFYHMRGPHAPFYLTDDLRYESTGRVATYITQGKSSLKIVYTYMEQMKALGKYEDATIIITADHGQGNISDSENWEKPDRTSRTLFLVKNSGEHHERMKISEAPVSQAELIPTILKAFGMEYASYGRTFEEIPVSEQRVRKYIDIYGNYNIAYVIDGHAAELDSWSVESAVYY